MRAWGLFNAEEKGGIAVPAVVLVGSGRRWRWLSAACRPGHCPVSDAHARRWLALLAEMAESADPRGYRNARQRRYQTIVVRKAARVWLSIGSIDRI